MVAELAGRQGSDVEDADQGALDNERDAEQRPNPLLPEQWIDHLDRGAVEILNHDGLAGRRDAPRKAPPDRQPEATLHLLLQALGGPRREGPAIVFDEKDGRGVDPEDLDHSLQELG